MKRISKRQVLLLHNKLIAESGGSNGIRDDGLLDSALSAPYQEYVGFSNYPTIEEKAARLGYGLINNHPFVDGNKRIGAHIMLLFLCINGVELKYEQEELIDIILKVASGQAGYDELYAWVVRHKLN